MTVVGVLINTRTSIRVRLTWVFTTPTLPLSSATTCVRENCLLIAYCEWRNTCSNRDYCTVNTQSSDVSCCGLSCHVHIAASSSLKVTLSVLHLTVVLCLLKSFVNTTWHGLSVSRSGCTRAHIHTHSIWAGEHNLSIVNQKFQYLLLPTWCALTFHTNLLKCHYGFKFAGNLTRLTI